MRSWCALNRSPKVRRFMGDPLRRSATVLWPELSRLANTPEQPLVVFLTATGEFVGQCGFLIPHSDPTNPEFYCAFRFKFWRKGYAIEVSEAMIAAAFEHLHAATVVALIDPGHSASIALVQKLGFKGGQPRIAPGTRQHGHLLYVFAKPAPNCTIERDARKSGARPSSRALGQRRMRWTLTKSRNMCRKL